MIALFPEGSERDIARRAAACAIELRRDSEKFH